MFYDYKDAMVDYLPWYDKENELIVNVCRALELAFRDLDKKYDFIYSNLFLDTAVDMLPLFIKKLGLKVSDGASIDDKRGLIQAYMHYLHQQTTEKIVAEMVQGTINGDVEAEISRDKEVDVFNLDIKVRSMVTNNLEDVEKMLKKILPSHLWIKTQVAVLTDVKFSVVAISGEEIVISQPALDDLVIDRPFTVRASNAGTYEHIEINGEDWSRDYE